MRHVHTHHSLNTQLISLSLSLSNERANKRTMQASTKRKPLSTNDNPKRAKFPRGRQYAEKVFTPDKVYRDNSKFLEEFEEHECVTFSRPTQLGKSTFFTLADWFYNKKKTAPSHLKYKAPDHLKNKCYVLSVDFGAVGSSTSSTTGWQDQASKYDKSVREQVQRAILRFLHEYEDVKGAIDFSSAKTLACGDLLLRLAQTRLLSARSFGTPSKAAIGTVSRLAVGI